MASDNSFKKRKHTNEVTTTVEDGGGLLESLPGDILTDIFSRLPISSLARLMFVCRSWRSILTQHGLVSSSSPCLLLHCDSPIRNSLHFLDSSEEDKPIKIKKFTLRFSSSMPEFDVVGSCNGLLCLSDSLYNDSLYLYNPFTTNSLELPKSSNKYHDQELIFGFGFHQKTKEYKVVKIVFFRDSNSSYKGRGRVQYKKSEVQILTVPTRTTNQSVSWRSLGKAPYKFVKRSAEALVNGRLHFVTRPDRKFVSFDLDDEEFREIPKPDCGGINRTNHRLVNLNGYLCAVVYGNYMKLDIWVMRSYGVKESWGKECSIGTYLPKGLKQNLDRPMWIWKNGENGKVIRVICVLDDGEILLEYKSRVLVTYDPKVGKFKDLVVHGMPNWFHTVVHVGTFSWLDTPLDL